MLKERNEKFLKDHGIVSWGDFNHPPTPYEKCDPEEMGGFWMHLSTWGIREELEFRQVYLDKPYIESIHLYIWHDAIYIVRVNRVEVERCKWKDVPTIYKVGCKHEYTEEKISQYSDYRATCKKCGYSYTYNCGD
jgi:hypothetical protein